MQPATVTTPKWLLPVAGRPFADWQLRWLATQGVDRVVVAIGHLGDEIREVVGEGAGYGIDVDYSADGPVLLGTGGALRLAADRGLLDDVVVVMYGDSYLSLDVARVVESFDDAGAAALMTVYENDGRFDTSNVAYADGVVSRYTKGGVGPGADGALRHIDYGLSVLRRSTIDEIPAGAAHDLGELFGRLAEERRLAGYEVHDRFYEIGSPSGLRDLEDHLRTAGEARR